MKENYNKTTITIIVDYEIVEKINKLRARMMAPPSTSRWVKELLVESIEQMERSVKDNWRYDPAKAFASVSKKFVNKKKESKDVFKIEESPEEDTKERTWRSPRRVAMSIKKNTKRG